jgi:hypothetical protein
VTATGEAVARARRKGRAPKDFMVAVVLRDVGLRMEGLLIRMVVKRIEMVQP